MSVIAKRRLWACSMVLFLNLVVAVAFVPARAAGGDDAVPRAVEAQEVAEHGPFRFGRLAHVISDPYSRTPTDPENVSEAARNSRRGLAQEIQDVWAGHHPAIDAAVKQLWDGRDRANRAAQGVRAEVDAANRYFEHVCEAARNGEYSSTSTSDRTVETPQGGSYTYSQTTTTDHSFLPLAGAALMKGFVESNAPAQMQARMAMEMERGRVGAWGDLLPKLGDFYPTASAAGGDKPLVDFRFNAADPVADRQPTFTAVNVSGRSLTRVTLAVDLFHFTTSPDATTRRVWYFRQWDAGQLIYLPRTCVPNLPSPALAENRPLAASPARNPFHAEPYLAGVGGVVSAKYTVWSAELKQPEKSVTFPANVNAAAEWELGAAYGLATQLLGPRTPAAAAKPMAAVRPAPAAAHARPNTTRRDAGGGLFGGNKAPQRASRESSPPGAATGKPAAPSEVAPAGTKTPEHLPEYWWSVPAAKRVLSFVPPESEWASDAKALLDSPGAAYAKWQKRRADDLLRLTASPRYAGDWSFHLLGFSLTISHANKLTLASRRGTAGMALLVFGPRAPGSQVITATLTDPGRPAGAGPHKLSGKVETDPMTGRVVLTLQTVGPHSKVVDADIDPKRLDPTDPTYPLLLRIESSGDELKGWAAPVQGYGQGMYRYDLVLRREAGEEAKN